MALSINSSTGVTLASERKLYISKIPRSRSAVSTRLPMEQHPLRNYEGDSPDLEKLCFHGIPRKGSAVSTRHPTLQHPYKYLGDIITNSMPYARLPTDTPTKARISFWFTSDAFCKRPILSYRDSYVKFLIGDLRAKVVPKRTTNCVS